MIFSLALLPLTTPAAEFEGVKLPDSARITDGNLKKGMLGG